MRLDHVGVVIWLGGLLLGAFVSQSELSWWWIGLAGVLVLGGGALMVAHSRRQPQLRPFGQPPEEDQNRR